MELVRKNPSKLTRPEADFERQRFEFYAAERSAQLDERAKEAWELYHNDRDGTDTQYTRKQVEMLEQVGAPKVSINFIMPIIQNQKAVLTADRPTGRILPSWGAADKQTAYLYDAILSATWQRSHGDAHYRKAVKDMLLCYLGIMTVEPQTFYRKGKFNLAFDYVSWEDMYIDPTAKESGLCFSDAEAMYVAKLLPRRKVENIYGFVPDERGEQMKTEIFVTPEERENEKVLIRNLYEKQYGIYCLLAAKDPVNRMHFLTRRVFRSEAELDRFRRDYDASLQDYVENVYIRKRTILGMDDVLEDLLLPLTVYPFAIFTPDDYNNPFGKSPVEYMREMQKALNKFVQTTILNAQLSSNTRFMGPKGAVANKDAFTKYGATPGAYYEYIADPSLPDGGRPIQIQPLPLASAWYQLGGEMKADMEYSAGRPAFTQGDPSEAPGTARASAQVGEYANLRPREIKARCETAMAFLYKAAMEYVSYYGDREQIMRYVDDREELVELPLGRILDDTRIIEHDVVPSVKTSLPTDRVEMKESLRLAMQQTADPKWQEAIFEELIEHQDTMVADRLRKKFDVIRELQGQLQQMQEQLNERDKLIDRLSTEVIVGKEKAAVAKMEGDLKAMKAETKAKMQVAIAKVEGQGGEQVGKSGKQQQEIAEL